ncbi:MAG: hypothetical protein JWM16_6396 [Verrucomicrobiales bacterium]|nr:hypothetical protein [Verrucomicrobiales bacterium]
MMGRVKRAVIRNLAQLLPSDAAFFLKIFGRQNPSLAMRIQACLEEPRFGEYFVRHYVSNGLQLPPTVTEKLLLRAYFHLAWGEPDDCMETALNLEHPANLRKRDILRALLVSKDFAMPESAQALGISEQTVQIYDCLCFNVRDRMNEALYISSIVWPNGRSVEHSASSGEALLRAGYDHGTAAVLDLAGFRREREKFLSIPDQLQRMEETLLAEAGLALNLGLAHTDEVPALQRALRILQANFKNQAKQPPAQPLGALVGLPAMSHGRAINDTLKEQQRRSRQVRKDGLKKQIGEPSSGNET